MSNIIHLKNLTPEQFDKLATQNMVHTMEQIGYFEPKPEPEYIWPLDDDFGVA